MAKATSTEAGGSSGPTGAPEAAWLSPRVPQLTPGPQLNAGIGRTSGPLASSPYPRIPGLKGRLSLERRAVAGPTR